MQETQPAPWSGLGEQNVARLVRVAEAGNVEVARGLWSLFHRLRRDGQPQPSALQCWVDTRLEASRQVDLGGGDPDSIWRELRLLSPTHRADDHSRDLEANSPTSMKEGAAWIVFRCMRPPYRLPKESDKGEDALDIAVVWLAERGEMRSKRAVRHWYEERRLGMEEQQRRVEAIMRELEGDEGRVLPFPDSNA